MVVTKIQTTRAYLRYSEGCQLPCSGATEDSSWTKLGPCESKYGVSIPNRRTPAGLYVPNAELPVVTPSRDALTSRTEYNACDT